MSFIFNLVVFSLVAIPASFFVTAKSIFLLLSSGIMLSHMMIVRKVWSGSLGFFSILLFVLFNFFYAVSFFSEFNDMHVAAGVRYAGFLLVLFGLLWGIRSGEVSRSQLLRVIFISFMTYSLIKLALLSLVPLGVLSARELSQFIQDFGGSVTIGFWSEDARFVRVYFGNDVLNPFILFYFLLENKSLHLYRKKVETLFVFTSVLLAILSVTRFVWVVEGVVILLFYCVLGQRFILPFFVLLVFCVIVGVLFFWDSSLFDTFLIRAGDSASLDMKSMQTSVLLERFYDAPLLGCGLGCYVPEFIRSEYLPFVYEVQLVALLMQFGLFGFVLIVSFLFSIVWRCKRFTVEWGVILLLYFAWVVSALTNPYLFILSSIVVYLLFYVLVRRAELSV